MNLSRQVNWLSLNIFKNKKFFPYKVTDTIGVGGKFFFSFSLTFTLEGGERREEGGGVKIKVRVTATFH